jgi:hypothetical protein
MAREKARAADPPRPLRAAVCKGISCTFTHEATMKLVALLALLAAAVAVPVQAADVGPITPDPIEIDSCAYVANQEGTKHAIRLSFVNVSKIVATVVRIRVEWEKFSDPRGRNPELYLRDVGTFTPNVTITHSFRAPEIQYDLGPCTIDSVHFADGSSWQAPFEGR